MRHVNLKRFMPQDVYVALWMETTPIAADFPHPVVAAVSSFFFLICIFIFSFSNREREKKDASLFRILLLLRASSHFHPFPPSPTPDSSLYRCSHKSHNAPVIITPTPVYLQPVAWRGASLSLCLFHCLPHSLLPLFFFAFLPLFLLLPVLTSSLFYSTFSCISFSTAIYLVFFCLSSLFYIPSL